MLLRDLASAMRSIRRAPLVSAVIVSTLAIAIGATVAAFSILQAVVLAPLPYRNADRLIALAWLDGTDPTAISLPDFADAMHASASDVASAAAFRRTTQTLQSAGEPSVTNVTVTTPGLFATLGVRPELGRFPTDANVRAGGEHLVVVSDAFWHERLGASATAIGSVIRLDGRSDHVAAVAPPGLQQPATHGFDAGFRDVDVWAIVPENGAGTAYKRGDDRFDSIARLRPGVSVAGVDASLARAAGALRAQDPADDATLGVGAVPLRESILGDESSVFFTIFAAVGAVLLVACANVANLLLGRVTARHREFSIRLAIGASRARIVVQVLVEAFVLAAIGAALGLALADGLVAAFVALHPPSIPRADLVAIDGRSLLFAAGVLVASTLAAGVAPAIAASRNAVGEALASAGRGGDASQGAVARASLVVCEIALTLALVVSAGLVVRSFLTLSRQPLGFDATNLVYSRDVRFPGRSFAADASRDAFERRASTRVFAIPGVVDAAWANDPPFTGFMSTGMPIVGRSYPPGLAPIIALRMVGPSFFRTLRMTIERGRGLTDDDRAGARRVAVVNERFAHEFFASGSPLGARVRPDVGDAAANPSYVIVGVVDDTRESLIAPVDPEVYVPIRQLQDDHASLVVRERPGVDARAAIASAIVAADPLQPRRMPRPLLAIVGASIATQRLTLATLCALAAIAIVLAAAGIFAVVSFGVTQRTHEFGIRAALGASGARIMRSVVARALRPVAAGIAFGLALAALATRFLSAQLYETQPLDPGTLAVVTMLIVAVAIVAASVPALRATRVDPIVALRYE